LEECRVSCEDGALSETVDLEVEVRSGLEHELPGIQRVTLVHRLRDARTLVAFGRITPLDRQELPNEATSTPFAKPQFVRGKRLRDWLPAVEVRGEGIFIELARESLGESGREPRVVERARVVSERYKEVASRWGCSERVVTPQFLFVHTFAHLLTHSATYFRVRVQECVPP